MKERRMDVVGPLLVSALILGLVLMLVMASGSQIDAAGSPLPLDLEPILNSPRVQGAISATVWFTDVAVEMNAAAPGYGTGVAWGDYDGDGELCLHEANQGACRPERLFRNDEWIYWPLVRRDS